MEGFNRRDALAAFLLGAAAVAPLSVFAEGSYPARPLRMVVPFSAGGGTDVVARALARTLSERLKQPVVIDNRAGAGSTIGTEAVARSPADGYTLLFASAAYSFAPAVYGNLPYRPEDLTAVAVVNSTPLMLTVNPSVPARDARAFIELLKTQPGRFSYASSGVGTTLHIAAEHFLRSAGVKAQHIPYKGEAPAMNDLLSGQVAFMVGQASSAVQYVKSGKLIGLGVTTPKRLASLPEMPTLAEAAIPGFSAYGWNAVLVPKGTPRAVIERLNREITAAVGSSQLQKTFDDLGLDRLEPMTPEGAAAFIVAETNKWRPVIQGAGIKGE
ncbi:Bug family tripartite tricarboxylate transporter substrate binding protein [Variovorax sp. PBL-E5]|uniref:Bug family tripartite tricarboxylate transporter substrate binding protein n=1 Tax=Variovorax sp. PBL-E5 TaxID=434014 RepID=UPI001317FD5B|nr:tripartite tricarboxylate transporter substrate binding protein [Variovorax sp. PBL-E5]VTU32087.1 Argininosuccinate lyase [Variovorax sp. PBL-E5]